MYRLLMILFLAVGLSACGGSEATPTTTKNDATPPVKKETEKTEKKNEATHPWAKFKVGSFSKTKNTTVATVAGHNSTTTSEVKQTLVDLTADKAVVEIESTVMGHTSKTKTEIPLTGTPTGIPTATAPASGGTASAPKEGTEDITVAGKTLHCKWIEYETEQGGNKVSSKTWMSDEVPGLIVKSVTKTTGSVPTEVTSELVAFETK